MSGAINLHMLALVVPTEAAKSGSGRARALWPMPSFACGGPRPVPVVRRALLRGGLER
eukprot:CAMPEP_0176310540 /NCGR_PEP_ID=MMETSP0121_2-20121125/65658_1 /TAXON_ID=160619 /ORGANISM="Kryptoperidinium foliaceum, Strain CCMP 1326" /LENGTH=57 /DNA_ID=CAMNT_0017652499 /DNA_START=56 /DNA_END=226 /DNA_ORIENTATION=-